MTGYSWGRPIQYDYVTVAYHAGTGRQLWVRRYNGPGQSGGGASLVAVNSRGTAVFVTGGRGTVAYRAGTGSQLWVRPSTGNDPARSLAVSPDGARVFVTGSVEGQTTGADYATVAYSAATGRQLWASSYNGPANDSDNAIRLVVNPRGTAVYVTGTSFGTTTGEDYATVAYSAATGRQLWVSRYNNRHVNWIDVAYSVAVSPDGTRVFVTGYSTGRPTSYDYSTVAYRG